MIDELFRGQRYVIFAPNHTDEQAKKLSDALGIDGIDCLWLGLNGLNSVQIFKVVGKK